MRQLQPWAQVAQLMASTTAPSGAAGAHTPAAAAPLSLASASAAVAAPSLLQRGVSAAGAALVAAVLVNPFDVVKTHLQTSPMRQPSTSRNIYLTSCNLCKSSPRSLYQLSPRSLQQLADIKRSMPAAASSTAVVCGSSSSRCGQLTSPSSTSSTIPKHHTSAAPTFRSSVRSAAAAAAAPLVGAGASTSTPATTKTMARCPPKCPQIGNPSSPKLCAPSCYTYNSSFDVLLKILRREGVSKLWAGTYASLLMAVPAVGIYLPCYDLLNEHASAAGLGSFSPVLAGSLARSLAVICTGPLELVRTRMQAASNAIQGKVPRSSRRRQQIIIQVGNHYIYTATLGVRLVSSIH